MNTIPDFNKNGNGLLPAIIQDSRTNVVLMLGYMNSEAYLQTLASGRVTFYSRSKNRLWVKGEQSGNFLTVVSVGADCDDDALLVKAVPNGPVCHTGSQTCWQESNNDTYGFISTLEQIIAQRRGSTPAAGSYIASLFEKGINKIAQKVGEEAVEVVIEAKDANDSLFASECADLLFHFLILLQAKNQSFDTIVQLLKQRNAQNHKKITTTIK